MGDVTQILHRFARGDRDAGEDLMQALYDELRIIASRAMRRERRHHDLQPTALVHEAYMRLVGQDSVEFEDRSHFLAIAARSMRQVLVDHARKADRQKRGGNWHRVTLRDAFTGEDAGPLDVLAVDEVLNGMHELDERQARVVELRIFGGLTAEEAAAALGISKRTADRDWKMGLAWLRVQLSDTDHR